MITLFLIGLLCLVVIVSAVALLLTVGTAVLPLLIVALDIMIAIMVILHFIKKKK